jgi:aminoglycoside phosphotransferase (APT) family kinase protein
VPVEYGGIDNKTFHLGNEMLVRMPSAKGYAAQVAKEQKWLPKLSSCLSMQIPEPVCMGNPSKNYPWHWSIYKWISGTSLNQLEVNNLHLSEIAVDLACFIKDLHQVDVKGMPEGGLHNYHRGCHLSIYDSGVKSDIQKLSNLIDVDKALFIWETAISSKWDKDLVLVHGDFASSNILLKDNKVNAIIDFGCMGVGDPACDLVINWTFLKGESRKIFKEQLNIDANTWKRARGWALWKANFELVAIADKDSLNAHRKLELINDILLDRA